MENKIKITGESWAALNMQLSDILIQHAFLNEKLNSTFPSIETIYHYTSLSGLISIIENQTLFCTNINYLNDKKEFCYGVGLILKVLEKLKKEDFEISVLEMIENHIDHIYKEERYVTCFSKDGDLLSQWRAYANQGKGVSIGFDFFKLDKSIDQPLHGKHIDYDENSQYQTVEELIRIIITFFKERKNIIDWEDFGYEWLVNTVIIDFLQGIIASYKSSSFKEEQEYRFEYTIDGNMVKKEDEEIHFRASETLIIPYIILEAKYRRFQKNKKMGKYNECAEEPFFVLKRLPIKEIIIGPSLDFDTIKSGLEELLFKHEYKDVLIKKSNIPYRI
ncbi:DUF2971 domain-containing protein [Dysgonomonas sp. 511]|uniref:DUF2971 domain-containing protein n=1 Tax=Dysgonomonas sp. 511 TaxID=2302930 RepID=UPI0013CF5EFF|nr:DUF2971 domain-containing protein [Dysgonomonas sp. 511]